MTNIHLFGGPGTGKSTTAAGLFYRMKKAGYNVEYVMEYAKDLTYSDEQLRLSDQLHLLGEQHHRLKRLHGKVDYVIHDSPFVMGLVYQPTDKHLPRKEFQALSMAMHRSYKNIDIFLERNIDMPFIKDGRKQDLKESEELDNKIRSLLEDNHLKYYRVPAGTKAVKRILSIVNRKN